MGYNSDQAGYMGLTLVAAGLVAAGVAAPLLDITHRYKEIYLIGYLICGAALAWLSVSFVFAPKVGAMIYASLGLMGVGAFIILPSALELSVETTFPVPAVTSAGFLWMGGQIVGIALLFGAGLLRDPVSGNMLNSMWLLCGVGLFGMLGSILLVYPLKTRYFRLEMEQKENALVN